MTDAEKLDASEIKPIELHADDDVDDDDDDDDNDEPDNDNGDNNFRLMYIQKHLASLVWYGFWWSFKAPSQDDIGYFWYWSCVIFGIDIDIVWGKSVHFGSVYCTEFDSTN